MDRHEAMGRLLDLTYQDQDDYLTYGNPERDYGKEWPETARDKADFYKQCAEIEAELGFANTPNRWSTMADELLTSVFGEQIPENAQVTQAEGGGNNPPGAAISGEVIAG